MNAHATRTVLCARGSFLEKRGNGLREARDLGVSGGSIAQGVEDMAIRNPPFFNPIFF